MKAYILIAVGSVLFCTGAFFAVMNYVDSSWPRVSSTVIATRSMNGLQVPVVEYTASGTKFQVIPSDQPLLGSFEKGKRHIIAYNPSSPGEAKITDSGILAMIPWSLMIVGAVLAVIGDIMRKRSNNDTLEDDESTESPDSTDTSVHQV